MGLSCEGSTDSSLSSSSVQQLSRCNKHAHEKDSKYAEFARAASCSGCESGRFSAAGAEACTKCDGGTWSNASATAKASTAPAPAAATAAGVARSARGPPSDAPAMPPACQKKRNDAVASRPCASLRKTPTYEFRCCQKALAKPSRRRVADPALDGHAHEVHGRVLRGDAPDDGLARDGAEAPLRAARGERATGGGFVAASDDCPPTPISISRSRILSRSRRSRRDARLMRRESDSR